MRYQVTWGDESAVVVAADTNDAWSVFCQGHALAAQHPKLHARKVLEVTEEPQRVLLVEASEPVVEPVVEVVEEVEDTSLEDDE